MSSMVNLCRLRDRSGDGPSMGLASETAKRYVITNPPFDFGLLPTDQVGGRGRAGRTSSAPALYRAPH